MHIVTTSMPEAALITGEGADTTLVLREGLVRPSVEQILALVLRDAEIPKQQREAS